MANNKLEINLDNDSLAFLQYLVSVKLYDAQSLMRVIDDPQSVSKMFKYFMKERSKDVFYKKLNR
tara:strand:- start:66 stop:260 length:195 start_codon:yes stop_codon:yes gene_type:complete